MIQLYGYKFFSGFGNLVLNAEQLQIKLSNRKINFFGRFLSF